jgi:PAS domain S-box-containing protein
MRLGTWFKDSYYNSLPADDLIGKQRYKLFRTTSFVGALACFVFVIQSLAIYPIAHPIFLLTLIIGMVFLVNMVWLTRHKNSRLAYVIINIAATIIIHLNMYDAGGLHASAMYFMAPITLMAFMLLGNKIGRIMFLLVLANVLYFYFITDRTTFVSLDLIGSDPASVNLDHVITAFTAFFILAAQLNYLESGKNIVIERITEQRNELRVKNIELRKLSIVASKADNAITITDQEGKAEWVNDGFTRLTGYPSEEILHQYPLAILHGRGTDRQALQELENAISSHSPYSGELLKYRKDGTRFWTQVTMTPITSDSGDKQQLIFIESDITPRKIAEEKMKQYMANLEKSNKELDKFAYVVSHDLKAPLRAIGNLTGWIEEDMGDNIPDSVRENFGTIKGRVVRMEGLIDGILDYTKAARNEGSVTTFNCADLLSETIDLIGPPPNAVIHIHDNIPTMSAERVKLQQVFLNLVHNAIRFNNKENILVEIGCEDKGANWEFFVHDNGPGIEQRFHEKIFVIFQTLNARDEVEAKGVGLAIVKKIIEEEGGAIWLESAKDQGATFRFSWPKKKRQLNEVVLSEEDNLF